MKLGRRSLSKQDMKCHQHTDVQDPPLTGELIIAHSEAEIQIVTIATLLLDAV